MNHLFLLLTLTLAPLTVFSLGGCNHVPQSATTDVTVAGGDYLTYQSPKATEITIESVVVDSASGALTLNGLSVKAAPDEATVTQTSAVDAQWADTIRQQSSDWAEAFGATASLLTSTLGSGAHPPISSQ